MRRPSQNALTGSPVNNVVATDLTIIDGMCQTANADKNQSEIAWDSRHTALAFFPCTAFPSSR
jgi:hypothetical protein